VRRVRRVLYLWMKSFVVSMAEVKCRVCQGRLFGGVDNFSSFDCMHAAGTITFSAKGLEIVITKHIN
jgi:hypothetical protein